MRKYLYVFLIWIFVPVAAVAAEEAAAVCPDPASLCSEYVQKALREARDLQGKPYPEYSKEKVEPRQHQEWEWAMPFMAQRVIDKGFSLPRPYGVSLIFFHQDQGINLSDLKLSFDPSAPLQDVPFVKFKNAHVENYTWQFKADMWVFPFLNVFGIVGTVKGSGNVPASFAAKDLFSYFGINICDGLGNHTPEGCKATINYDAPINYYGNTLGAGILLAAGIDKYFFAMPVTYVRTKVNVTDTPVEVFNMTPRVGYNWPTDIGKLGIYVGANYQQSKIVLSGSYVLPTANTEIGHDVTVQYQIKETPIDLWNAVAGVNWEISKAWSTVVELGYSQNRENQTFLMNYRF